MLRFENCELQRGENHNYLIEGNILNAFCLGRVGSPDDFYLVGAEPEPSSNFPLLTGNILNSEGELLFRIVRNEITLNPGNCSKIIGDHLGYEIHDVNDVKIFGVKTAFMPGAYHPDSKLVTQLSGNFFDKTKKLVVRAAPINQDGDERIELDADVVFALGFTGTSFSATSHSMSGEEHDFLVSVLSSRGAVYEPLRGMIVDREIELDGKVLIGATLERCLVTIRSANFGLIGKCKFTKCKFAFAGDAERIKILVLMLKEMQEMSEIRKKRRDRGKRR